jgi:uncharacterized protein with von Willebrand factor type A (vWA) domain
MVVFSARRRESAGDPGVRRGGERGEISDELDPRSTVIVLGDARTNGREPHADVFARVSERAGRLFWLNPEPRLYWNYGDSVMAAYERYCDGAFECWTTRHLENFVNVVALVVCAPA